MDKGMTALLDLAEAEFDGHSFNGPPMLKTLESLSAARAASPDTWEGYSAWEVVHHVIYFKYFVTRSLGAASALEPYPYPQVDFALAPPDATEEQWEQTLAYLTRVHRACMAAIRGLPDERLDAEMPEWKVPYRRAIAWLCAHDTYHTAQIRSMGVPGLKEPKH
jgi:uncharacterized damage-inducible protein DinB